MSAEALAYVWKIEGVTSAQRLALLWLANNSGGLGHPICPEWIGMGEFMCCSYQQAHNVMYDLVDAGLVVLGNEDEQTGHYVWIAYDGPLYPPIDWTGETKNRSKRVAALIERDGPHCAYCECLPVLYEVDHFIPKAKGGADLMSNLVLACSPCNRAKRDLDPEHFLKDRPELFQVISSNLKYLHE